MDILAHTLWTNAGARAANAVAQKTNKKENKKFHISPGWAAFWGVVPDFFAFTVPFIMSWYYIFSGKAGSIDFGLAHHLYNYSHSLVIFAIVFVIVGLIYKRPRYELLGWALHILIDIPSHTLAFFPTPFLFPISNYYFPYGIAWSNSWFMIINYSALALVWARIAFLKLRSSRKVL
jgi:hypothetical protein